jgi:hypothetical protein
LLLTLLPPAAYKPVIIIRATIRRLRRRLLSKRIIILVSLRTIELQKVYCKSKNAVKGEFSPISDDFEHATDLLGLNGSPRILLGVTQLLCYGFLLPAAAWYFFIVALCSFCARRAQKLHRFESWSTALPKA